MRDAGLALLLLASIYAVAFGLRTAFPDPLLDCRVRMSEIARLYFPAYADRRDWEACHGMAP